MIAPALTLRHGWERFYRPFIEPDDQPQTLRCHESAVRAWERVGLSAIDVRVATAATWSDFKRRSQARGLAAATVNHYLRSHRAILRFLHGEGLIERVPAIRPLREPEHCKPRPTVEQVGKLFAAVPLAGVDWPIGPPGFAVDWWQTFIVLAYVGAFRVSEIRRIRLADCTDAGVMLHAPKTGRLSFAPPLPCVLRQVAKMRAWSQPGNPFLMSCGHGHRQFDRARDKIGAAAGVTWRPHGLRRASVDAWFRVSETAGTIVGHTRRSAACRHYLDRQAYLASVSHLLPLPAEFSVCSRQLLLF